ncbi:MAG: efflux RND transporter permease subunit [Elusimicrobiota bacterium]
MFISEYSIKKPITVLMAAIAVIVLGVIAFTQLKIDLYPDMSFPMAAVITTYKGASPAEIESMVTRPLEKVISTVTNIKQVSSQSFSEMSLVMAEFNWETDMDAAGINVREKIDMIKGMMPKDMSNPLVFKFDPSMMPVMMISLTGPQSPAELRMLADDIVGPGIERIEGVASATVNGGLQREIRVELNRSRVYGFGLSVQQITGAIGMSNLTLPGGEVEDGDMSFYVRTVGQIREVKQLEDVVVGNQAGVPIYLKDVADIKDDYIEQTQYIRINGMPGIMIQVQKASSENTVQVARRIKASFDKIKRQLPQGCDIKPMMDTSIFIEKSIGNVQRSTLEGGLLAIIIILIFLRSFRSTFIISLAIPLSVIATFVLLYFGKLTLNIATLGGLALGVGRLVDDAIVVLESIYRHIQKGESPMDASVNGAKEVGLAVIASTITTVVVFVPMLFVTGLASIIFKPMAYTISFALVASLAVSLTVIPLLTSKFLHVQKTQGKFFKTLEAFFDNVDTQYQKLIEWALGHRKIVIFGVTGLLILSFVLIPFVGTEFMPSADEGELSITVKMPLGTKLEKTNTVMQQVEEIVMKNTPELDTMQMRLGTSGSGLAALASLFTGGGGSDTGSLRISLVELSKRKRSTEEVTDALRPLLKNIPGTEVKFGSGAGMAVGMMGGSALQTEIRGYDFGVTQKLAEQVKELMTGLAGVKDISISREAGLPELEVVVDRKRAAALGLSVVQIASSLQTNMEGSIASLYRDPEVGKEYNIFVQLRKTDRSTISDLDKVFVTSPMGKQVPLSNLVKIERRTGPSKIERKNQVRIVTVSANVIGRPSGTVSEELKKLIQQKVVIPANYNIDVAGSYKDQQNAFRDLLFALLLAILLIYMVLASQFESFIDPFIIMFSVPLGIIGVIWGLFLTGYTLNVVSFIGIIMMVGIVVSNGILLVDYTNHLRREGMDLYKAVAIAGHTRLRPILMTTLTTIIGMLPLALGIGEGGEIEAPMAVAVIAGLTVSTFLTLVFVPTLYTVIEERFKHRTNVE